MRSYSGVAWATASDFGRRQVNHITVWPEGRGEQGKTPSEICYDEDDENPTWGYGIPVEGDPVRWFKLLLLNNEDIPEYIRDSDYLIRGRKMMRENGKTAIGFVADYLRVLWKHVLDTISKSRGESVVDAFAFHVVITVPAIWKPYARQAMQTAADQADITASRPAGPTILSFVPEPEAAALASLVEQGEGVKAGDVYLICDAGGGTVVSYNFANTFSSSFSIEMRPCLKKLLHVGPHHIQSYQRRSNDLFGGSCRGDRCVRKHEFEFLCANLTSGGLCGGIFVDEAFERICRRRVGTKWNRISQAGIKKILKDEWELNIKQRFQMGNPKKEYILDLPAEVFKDEAMDDISREPYIKRGRIHFREYVNLICSRAQTPVAYYH